MHERGSDRQLSDADLPARPPGERSVAPPGHQPSASGNSARSTVSTLLPPILWPGSSCSRPHRLLRHLPEHQRHQHDGHTSLALPTRAATASTPTEVGRWFSSGAWTESATAPRARATQALPTSKVMSNTSSATGERTLLLQPVHAHHNWLSSESVRSTSQLVLWRR